MSNERSQIALMMYGEGPTNEPEEKPSHGFADRHFGALLAFTGVLATAALAAFSNLFGASGNNSNPSAEIVFAERFRPPGGAPSIALVTVGTTIRFFAGGSSDADSTLESLQHTWVVTPGENEDACKASESQCRYYDFKPQAPGDYLVSLVVSDAENFEQNCALIHRWNNKLGCRKNGIATAQIEVVDASLPEIVISGNPREVIRGESLRVDASMSRTFDGSVPHFLWKVDENIIARNRSTVGIPTLHFPDDRSEFAITIQARDRLGRQSIYTLPIQVVVPEEVAVSDVSSIDPPSPPNESSDSGVAGLPPLCRGAGSITLAAPQNVSVPDETCVLPSRVITNGHQLSLIAETIVGQGAIIRAFDEQAESGGNGSPGRNGFSGSSFGQHGAPGEPGTDGEDGRHGASAGPISLGSQRFLGQLRIVNAGQNGGDGGNGGRGGDGGAGYIGSPAVPGIFDCRSGPGRGGNGGAGGPGGDGGNGGLGGAGGPVFLSISNVSEGAELLGSAESGAPGAAGSGGAPGRGGPAGPEGTTSGLCGGASRSGAPGTSGVPGQPGGVPERLPPEIIRVSADGDEERTISEGQLRIFGEPKN